MAAVGVEFAKVSYTLAGSHFLLRDISLRLEAGTTTALLGRSGSGKTTLLRMVNGLVTPTSGEVCVGGKATGAYDAVTLRRSIGYVIQETGLFPHMTIGENIATVPKILDWSKQKIKERTIELLTLVELNPEEFIQRYPSQLSGGQQQRVGLARALAADPELMLMDEPFGAIDAITRMNLQNELLKIQRKFHKTILFVTHDINEAFKLGNRVLIMNQGLIQQYAAPNEIRRHPANEFVGRLVNSVEEQRVEWDLEMGGFI